MARISVSSGGAHARVLFPAGAEVVPVGVDHAGPVLGDSLDTRSGTGTPAGTVEGGRSVLVDMGASIAPGATGAVLNVTATDVTATTFVTAWPHGRTRPLASNLVADLAGYLVPDLGQVSTDVEAKPTTAESAADEVLEVTRDPNVSRPRPSHPVSACPRSAASW